MINTITALQLETISNLRWAITFSIATSILNLVSIGICLHTAIKMRKAAQNWRDAVARMSAPRS